MQRHVRFSRIRKCNTRIIYVCKSERCASLCERSAERIFTLSCTYARSRSCMHANTHSDRDILRIARGADKLWPQPLLWSVPLYAPAICSSFPRARVRCTTLRWSHRKQFRLITSSIRRNVDGLALTLASARHTGCKIENHSCAIAMRRRFSWFWRVVAASDNPILINVCYRCIIVALTSSVNV